MCKFFAEIYNTGVARSEKPHFREKGIVKNSGWGVRNPSQFWSNS